MKSDAAVEEGQVRENLQPGETFRAGVWVSKSSGHSSVRMSRADMSPFRFRKPVDPSRRSAPVPTQAGRIEEHIRLVSEPRILVLTDRRLMVLARRFSLLRPASQPWQIAWECPRADLTSSRESDGRLHLTFGDGSEVTLLTPSVHVQPFLEG